MARYIDRKRLIEDIQGIVSNVCLESPYDAEWFTRLADRQKEIIDIIEEQPIADVVEVIRCKNCIYRWFNGVNLHTCVRDTANGEPIVNLEDFCSYGKKVE